MHTVDPNAGKVGQCGKVLVAGQVLRLEASHLGGGSGLSFDGLAADNPAHGRITAKTVGVVHVFITAKASKHRLTKQSRHAMPSIFAGTAVLQKTPGPLAQAKGIVKLPIGEQSGVRCDPGTVELQLQATVEIDPQMGVFGFTRRVTRGWLVVVLVSH